MIGTRNSGLLGWIILIVIVGCRLFTTELVLAGGPPVQWQKTFGGSEYDMGWSVQQTSDGGYVIAGKTESFGVGYEDVYLIKTNPNGDSQWEKTFGGSEPHVREEGKSVQQTSDGGYVIAGTRYMGIPRVNDVYLIKTEPNGNSQWEKTFETPAWGYSVQQTADGGYIIAGSTDGLNPGTTDVYLIKTDPNGDSQWEKTFGGSAWDSGGPVQQTLDGGYIIAGSTDSFGAGYDDVYLIKTEPNGSSQWQKTFGGSRYDCAHSVQQTTDGGYIIAGSTSSFVAGYDDVYLIKTDPNGDSEWEKTFGGSAWDSGWFVQQTSDDGYVIAGITKSFGAGGSDVYLIKTDPNGYSQWQKTFGGTKDDYGTSVRQTADGGYIIAGATYTFAAGDVYLIKLCPEGTLSGDLNCDGTVNYEDVKILVSQWLQPRSILSPHADIYGVGDGIVDFFDYSTQAEDFRKSYSPH